MPFLMKFYMLLLLMLSLAASLIAVQGSTVRGLRDVRCNHLPNDENRFNAKVIGGKVCCLCPKGKYWSIDCKIDDPSSTVCTPCPWGDDEKSYVDFDLNDRKKCTPDKQCMPPKVAIGGSPSQASRCVCPEGKVEQEDHCVPSKIDGNTRTTEGMEATDSTSIVTSDEESKGEGAIIFSWWYGLILLVVVVVTALLMYYRHWIYGKCKIQYAQPVEKEELALSSIVTHQSLSTPLQNYESNRSLENGAKESVGNSDETQNPDEKTTLLNDGDEKDQTPSTGTPGSLEQKFGENDEKCNGAFPFPTEFHNGDGRDGQNSPTVHGNPGMNVGGSHLQASPTSDENPPVERNVDPTNQALGNLTNLEEDKVAETLNEISRKISCSDTLLLGRKWLRNEDPFINSAKENKGDPPEFASVVFERVKQRANITLEKILNDVETLNMKYLVGIVKQKIEELHALRQPANN